MAPTLPAKSPRMSPHKLHHEHPAIPMTQPQQEIIIDKYEENGREVGGIVYHPLGKGNGKSSAMKEREGMGEGAGWKADRTHHQSSRQAGGGWQGEVGYEGDRLRLQRQPHRDYQETGPSPLPPPAALTANHHPSANHHHSQPHVNTSEGPRLYIQPPTPENPAPPALQVRSLNTSNPIGENVHPTNRSSGEHKGKGVGNGQAEGEGGGEGIMSRFKTTFLSKNKGPMSKTWARKSYLDELESMAPTSPTSTSPRDYRSAPVTPHGHGHGDGQVDLESGRQGMRRISRDQREVPRARSVYASPIALAQFKALPPVNPQGEAIVAPR